MSHVILLIEDEAILSKNICLYLNRSGFDVTSVETAEAGLQALAELRPDAVVLDFNLPGMDGLKALQLLREHDAQMPVVMITGHGHVELAVEAMKAGAVDFLTKPVALSKLQLVLDKAISGAQRDGRLDYFRKRSSGKAEFAGLLGESAAMQALKRTISHLLEVERSMKSTEPPAVLVLGETGTGKELIARALHFGGPRSEQAFIELNCAALPAQLLESELFGHERGAFTDARTRKLGLVETAEGGTLFLDEIGDMDLALQVKLLKLLEDKTVRRVGSVREQAVNVRIIAATHQPLESLVQQGRFRADLYFRLNVVQLKAPPLRDREGDVALLAAFFIEHHARRYGKPRPVLSADAVQRLLAHHWPGNVRELRNVLDQAVLLCRQGVIGAEQLPVSDRRSPPASADTSRQISVPGGLGRNNTLPELERQALVEALERTRGNVSRAARELAITRDALRYRMVKHGLIAEGEG